MGDVISATTRFSSQAQSTDRARESKKAQFIGSAHRLLSEAYGHVATQRWDQAVESAYQAALRTAGAWIVDSDKLAKRKRLPSSAWDRLALTGSDGKAWAETLRDYSSFRSHVASGVESQPKPKKVQVLVGLVDEFLAQTDADWFGDVA